MIGAEGAKTPAGGRGRGDPAGAQRRGGSPDRPRKAKRLERKATDLLIEPSTKKRVPLKVILLGHSFNN
ncbi:hypothetical protein [Bacillus sp. X1(2014)]|uniref:hypothetical protein n=1 Tax=Bacillus sp. X1(2014) TaxID=1565991 RepID=UPI001C92D79E|nr:hypothetical protein [Bacillus sp. X1(2014)]